MEGVFLVLCVAVYVADSAPLYGENGGYQGFASYTPFKNALKRSSLHSEDSIDASAGSPEIIRQPNRQEEDSSSYAQNSLPKKYDVLDYKPSYQHGYGGNKISNEIPETPYHRATLYGQSSGGYKIADAYPAQHIDSEENSEGHDYKDDYLSNPQPYEYGYELKDHHGNTQHRHETSDGHGNVKGSYGFTDEHGLYRSVEYVAGKDGFKALVKTNEPGTKSEDPAHVHVEAEKPEYE